MNEEEFQRKYHDYDTEDVEAAKVLRDEIVAAGVDVVVVGPLIGGRYCLMLRTAAKAMALIDPSVVIVREGE